MLSFGGSMAPPELLKQRTNNCIRCADSQKEVFEYQLRALIRDFLLETLVQEQTILADQETRTAVFLEGRCPRMPPGFWGEEEYVTFRIVRCMDLLLQSYKIMCWLAERCDTHTHIMVLTFLWMFQQEWGRGWTSPTAAVLSVSWPSLVLYGIWLRSVWILTSSWWYARNAKGLSRTN